MENHHAINGKIHELSTGPFSIAMLNYQRVDRNTAWWFGTWNLFFHILYWECHHPNWRTHIFQRGWHHQPEYVDVWWVMDGWWTFIDDDLWCFIMFHSYFGCWKIFGMMILYFSRHILGMGWKPAGTESRTGWFSIASFHCRSASTWWKFTKTSGVKVPEDQWTKTRGFTLNTGEFHSTYSYPRGVEAISGLRVWTVSLLHHKQDPPRYGSQGEEDSGPAWVWPCRGRLDLPWRFSMVSQNDSKYHGFLPNFHH